MIDLTWLCGTCGPGVEVTKKRHLCKQCRTPCAPVRGFEAVIAIEDVGILGDICQVFDDDAIISMEGTETTVTSSDGFKFPAKIEVRERDDGRIEAVAVVRGAYDDD